MVWMVCPFCSHDIAPSWQPLMILTDELGRQRSQAYQQIDSQVPEDGVACPLVVTAQWMICQNYACRQVLVQVTRSQTKAPKGGKHGVADTQTWFAVPKVKCPPNLDPLVTDPWRKDYIEAHTILDDSPRMSSVLSRRILADLLKQYAGLDQFNLEQRIDAFVSDTKHPRRIRENLHYLREMGNFGAHTQEQAPAAAGAVAAPQPAVDPVIIDVEKSEAEWSLKVVADLFDYFIVAPEKDAQLRKAFDKKIADADRKPIKPLTT
jgi:hypothetical protein